MKDNKPKHFAGTQLLRQQFAQQGGGVFDQALSTQDICSVVEQQSNATARHRLCPPLKTLSLFIGQILYGARTCVKSRLVINTPQRALKHLTLAAALKKWQQEKPELFVKRVYNQAGLDV